MDYYISKELDRLDELEAKVFGTDIEKGLQNCF